MKVSITKNQVIKILLVLILGINTSMGQEKNEPKRHAINFCPGGIAFGIFSANYEYLVTPSTC